MSPVRSEARPSPILDCIYGAVFSGIAPTLPPDAMFNLAALSRLMMVIAGPVCGLTAPQTRHPGTTSVILFVIGGSLFGIGLAAGSHKLEHIVLKSKKMHGGLEFLVHVFIPLFSIFIVIGLPFLIAALIPG